MVAPKESAIKPLWGSSQIIKPKGIQTTWLASQSVHKLASRYIWQILTFQSQDKSNSIFETRGRNKVEYPARLVKMSQATLELDSTKRQRHFKFQDNSKPERMPHNSIIIEVVWPKFYSKPMIHSTFESLIMPHAPTLPELPCKDPSVLSFQKFSDGGFHPICFQHRVGFIIMDKAANQDRLKFSATPPTLAVGLNGRLKVGWKIT